MYVLFLAVGLWIVAVLTSAVWAYYAKDDEILFCTMFFGFWIAVFGSLFLGIAIEAASPEGVVKTETQILKEVDGEWIDRIDNTYFYNYVNGEGYSSGSVTPSVTDTTIIEGSDKPRIEKDICDELWDNWTEDDPSTCAYRIYLP